MSLAAVHVANGAVVSLRSERLGSQIEIIGIYFASRGKRLGSKVKMPRFHRSSDRISNMTAARDESPSQKGEGSSRWTRVSRKRWRVQKSPTTSSRALVESGHALCDFLAKRFFEEPLQRGQSPVWGHGARVSYLRVSDNTRRVHGCPLEPGTMMMTCTRVGCECSSCV